MECLWGSRMAEVRETVLFWITTGFRGDGLWLTLTSDLSGRRIVSLQGSVTYSSALFFIACITHQKYFILHMAIFQIMSESFKFQMSSFFNLPGSHLFPLISVQYENKLVQTENLTAIVMLCKYSTSILNLCVQLHREPNTQKSRHDVQT